MTQQQDAALVAAGGVRLEVADGVAVVTLDRPPVNALNRAMRAAIVATFDALSERPDVRCVVLSAAGRVFCAGADLKDRPDAHTEGDFLAHNRITRETTNAIRECAKPVIAAVNGAALGAGLGLVAACDILYACEEASFAMPEIDVGLAGGAASGAQHIAFDGAQVGNGGEVGDGGWHADAVGVAQDFRSRCARARRRSTQPVHRR